MKIKIIQNKFVLINIREYQTKIFFHTTAGKTRVLGELDILQKAGGHFLGSCKNAGFSLAHVYD